MTFTDLIHMRNEIQSKIESEKAKEIVHMKSNKKELNELYNMLDTVQIKIDVYLINTLSLEL